MEIIDLIKNSFEEWFNKNLSQEAPMSIVINYSDVQKLSLKAFHTITMDVEALGIRDNKSYAVPLVHLQENYNHGITSEEEAKEGLTKKLLMCLYGFSQ